MIDFDSIWRTQDEIRTVVNAVQGAVYGIWPMTKGAWLLSLDSLMIRKGQRPWKPTNTIQADSISALTKKQRAKFQKKYHFLT